MTNQNNIYKAKVMGKHTAKLQHMFTKKKFAKSACEKWVVFAHIYTVHNVY